MTANFTTSPTKVVNFVDKEGKVVKTMNLNRKQRRKMGIRGKK